MTISAYALPIKPGTHLINEVPYKNADGTYNVVVEIPAGTREKWQTDKVTGQLYHDVEDGKPRIVNFLSYPANYGMLPQTLVDNKVLLDGKHKGDGDPVDVFLLSEAVPRGSVIPARVVGALRFLEKGEVDDKLIAIHPEGAFAKITELWELLQNFPGAVEIVRLFTEGYKGPGKFFFQSYIGRDEASRVIEQYHQSWKAEQQQPPSPDGAP